MQFNPPPNWPTAPDGWRPGPDWRPDPRWPQPPPGWEFWISDSVPTPAHPSPAGFDEEVLVREADGIYRWHGPKRGQTLVTGTVGRLVLTTRRLMFLSTGGHDVSVGRIVGGVIAGPVLGLTTRSTSHLDLGALRNPNSLEVPLGYLQSYELKGMFKYLSLAYTDPAGRLSASAFAPKNGGMTTWDRSLQDAICQLGGSGR